MNTRSDDLEATLASVVDRIIPADGDPGAAQAGALSFVLARLNHEAASEKPAIDAGLRQLDAAAHQRHGMAFPALGPAARDALLTTIAGAPWFRTLADLTAEGFYADAGNGGNEGEVSWRMIGFSDAQPAAPAPRKVYAPHRDEEPDDIVYDAIVVGGGAGGGIAACVLAEAGKRVLLLERGDAYDYEISGKRDHLRNHRNLSLGHNTGPDLDGHPRVLVDPEGGEHVVAPNHRYYHSNAAGPGSGTAVYGAQAWRFLPDDFRMATKYGLPAGSSLADWPFSYDELAPDYERAEWEIGVAGEDLGHPAPRRRGYPMPPVPGYAIRSALKSGAAKLGVRTFAPPLLLNTVPRHGRAACLECATCVGFACPSDAKNGSQNTVIARALVTGRCTLVLTATVERIVTDASGGATGVVWRKGFDRNAPQRTTRSRSVVLAAGAIETARLLLMSDGEKHRHGLGNAHDQVGRHLQGHIYPTAYGQFDDAIVDMRGPGVTIATCDYNHGNKGVIGGAMLADDFIVIPTLFWKNMLPPDAPFWGQAAKDFMRRNYRRITQVRGPVQEIPAPDCRVTLDPSVKDRFGLPVARLSGVIHPETLRTTEFMLRRAEEWITAAGAKRVWSQMPKPRLSGGQHQAGTARMGNDPRSSVTDAYGRVHGAPNVVVADASLHVTNGGFNPVLTVMALAYRVSTRLAAAL